jgi:hypothetical protein
LQASSLFDPLRSPLNLFQQVFLEMGKRRPCGHHLGQPLIDPGRDVAEVGRHEVVGELVA